MTPRKRSGRNLVSASRVSYMWLSASKTGKSSWRDGIWVPSREVTWLLDDPTLGRSDGKRPPIVALEGAGFGAGAERGPGVLPGHDPQVPGGGIAAPDGASARGGARRLR